MEIDKTEETKIIQKFVQVPPFPLNRKWSFWKHVPCFNRDYSSSRILLNENKIIDTIQSFWSVLINVCKLDKPSKFFFGPGKLANLEGFSFFEENVTPDWEHERNKFGSSIIFKSCFNSENIDVIWQNSLLVLIGETICKSKDISNHIVGIRIITRGHNSRLEIWTDQSDKNLDEQTRDWFLDNVFSLIDNFEKDKIQCFINSHLDQSSGTHITNQASLQETKKPESIKTISNPESTENSFLRPDTQSVEKTEKVFKKPKNKPKYHANKSKGDHVAHTNENVKKNATKPKSTETNDEITFYPRTKFVQTDLTK